MVFSSSNRFFSSGSFGFISLFVFQYPLEKFTLLILWNLRCFTIEVFAVGFSSVVQIHEHIAGCIEEERAGLVYLKAFLKSEYY